MGLTQISFVYFNFAIILFALIWFFLLAAYVLRHLKTIAKNHSTISSFCSDPSNFANRLLLAITASLGNNLTCMLVESYNSRKDQDIRFWIEVASALMLPLVGIFYTSGGDYTKKFDLGLFQIPIRLSEFIHSFAALGYFFTFSVTNSLYSYQIFEKSSTWNLWPTIFLVICITSNICLILFLVLQGYIFMNTERFAAFRSSQEENEEESDLLHPSSFDEQVYLTTSKGEKFIRSKDAVRWYRRHLHVYAASIILEALIVLFVTFVATAGSMRRNDSIPWFA